ncbi:MAG: hypothetical protein LUE21_04655 [Oscillospiraceae bacterium]|nr:hypothetical protein [Oscillospiraceae bacterium]
MKKRLLALICAAVLLFACGIPAMADSSSAETGTLTLTWGDLTAGDLDLSEQTVTNQEVVAYLLRWAGMEESQLGSYPDDYNSLAESMGMTDGIEDYDPTAPCTQENLAVMMETAQVLYDALHADTLEPLFLNGMAQPIFPFTSGATEEGYDNADSDIIRYCVYVETNYDTDGDGQLDLVKALVQVPRAAVEGDYEAATIYEARPYIAGTTDLGWGEDPHVEGGYDLESMYSQPEARTPASDPVSTLEAAADADSSDWYYWNECEEAYDYEDLDWYDYYLVRGYAVVVSAGIGTLGSEGFETCGTDLEIDAFKCIIEWLHGDRVAYTDTTSNIPVEADWSNGKVGMTGRSYAGTTQFALATTGVEGLETIVPVAGIASWYEYTNSQGISTEVDVAYSDWLASYCASRYLDEDDWASIKESYGMYLQQIKEDQEATNGDYSEHWAVRDYTLNAENIQCSALIVHGLNDDNVRTKQFDLMYQAFEEADATVKLLLHQDSHVTPTYPSQEFEFLIDDQYYDELLNKWFSHYLYDVDNGIEDMPAVTAQSNTDGQVWNTYDDWKTDQAVTLTGEDAEEETTTISSDYDAIGVDYNNWEDTFTSGSTESSAMYTMEVTEDMVIKGTVAVSFQATTTNGELVVTVEEAAEEEPEAAAEDASEEASAEASGEASAEASGEAPEEAEAVYTELEDRDALMVSAMLVDIAPEGETFSAFVANPTYVDTVTLDKLGAWMGGGLENYDLVELAATEVSYKIIARGWMDLCNPGSGYASSDVAEKVSLVEGEYYDYTIYLQPNLYEVEAGHTLALVIYTWEPGKAEYTQNYFITIDNATVSASIPID